MFIQKLFLFFIALLFGTALAAPVLYERTPSDEITLDARAPIFSTAKQKVQAAVISHKLKQKFNPKKNEAVFWSGHRPEAGKPHGVSVKADAQKFADKHGKKTIGNYLSDHKINIPEPAQNKYSDHLWDVASKAMAKKAKGHVHVIAGDKVRDQSVYLRVEKPALLKNKKVTKVTEHNMATGEEKIIKNTHAGHK